MVIPSELIDRVKNGDTHAADELYRRLRRNFRTICRRNGIVDEDAIQEALIAIWTEIEKLIHRDVS